MGYSPSPFAGEPASYGALADHMSASWASFFVDLDPNSWLNGYTKSATPQWPKYATKNPQNIVWNGTDPALAELEPDTFRADGISLIIDNLASVYKA
jgi:hypothetical protein